MRAVVLAGMHAWGDCVLESAVTRPLLPILGRPLIAHTLDWLRSAGVNLATICANSNTAVLRHRLGSGAAYGVELEYYEDVMPRGPAGCTRDAVMHSSMDTVLVVEGTILPRIDLGAFLLSHATAGAGVTVAVVPPGRPADGVWKPAGLYAFSRTILSEIPLIGYQDIKESLLPRLHRRGERVCTRLVEASSMPRITGPASYLAVHIAAMEQMLAGGAVPRGFVRLREALVHESVRFGADVSLVGPVWIDAGCRVESGAMIVGPTAVGASCVIGRNSVVSRSILWSGCAVDNGARLDQCIAVEDAHVLQGAVVHCGVVLAPVRDRPASLRNDTSGRWAGMGELSAAGAPAVGRTGSVLT